MDRYWIFVNQKLEGPFEVGELMALEGFHEKMLVCRQGDEEWKPAQQFTLIRQRLMIAVERSVTPTIAPVTPAPTPIQKSGDFISPNFQFAEPAMTLSPVNVPPAKPVTWSSAPQATKKHLARRKRVLVIAVFSVLFTMGNLFVYASHLGILRPAQTSLRLSQQKIQGTRFSQRIPTHRPRRAVAVAAAIPPSPVLRQHKPWFDAASRRPKAQPRQAKKKAALHRSR